MLSTPWPRACSESMSSRRRARASRVSPAMTRCTVVTSSPRSRRYPKASRTGSSLMPGVEQVLDRLELEEIPVGVAAARPAALGIGQRRPDEVGAGPVVELAVGDADDVGGLAAAEALVLMARRPSSLRWWVPTGDIGGVTPMSCGEQGTAASRRRQRWSATGDLGSPPMFWNLTALTFGAFALILFIFAFDRVAKAGWAPPSCSASSVWRWRAPPALSPSTSTDLKPTGAGRRSTGPSTARSSSPERQVGSVAAPSSTSCQRTSDHRRRLGPRGVAVRAERRSRPVP